MNGRVAKKLRKICPPLDPLSKKFYKRLKSQYKLLPHNARNKFIRLLEEKTKIAMDR
jgi:hypothetical protein